MLPCKRYFGDQWVFCLAGQSKLIEIDCKKALCIRRGSDANNDGRDNRRVGIVAYCGGYTCFGCERVRRCSRYFNHHSRHGNEAQTAFISPATDFSGEIEGNSKWNGREPLKIKLKAGATPLSTVAGL